MGLLLALDFLLSSLAQSSVQMPELVRVLLWTGETPHSAHAVNTAVLFLTAESSSRISAPTRQRSLRTAQGRQSGNFSTGSWFPDLLPAQSVMLPTVHPVSL